jgi:hypothetical protein
VTEQHRYIDYQRSLGGGDSVSIGKLMPEPDRDASGRVVRQGRVRQQISAREVGRLLQPYLSRRFRDQFKAVAPLAAYLVLFQLFILRQLVEDSWIITGGLLAVIVGLCSSWRGSISG